MPAYWLMKSEPSSFSIDDLRDSPHQTTCWDGVRNYQARNFMRQMKIADGVLFYHSSCPVPGIVGIAEVTREAYADSSAWCRSSEYFDSKSTKDQPRWDMVDIRYVEKFDHVVSLTSLKEDARFSSMRLVQRGNRLSVMPISATHYDRIRDIGAKERSVGAHR